MWREAQPTRFGLCFQRSVLTYVLPNGPLERGGMVSETLMGGFRVSTQTTLLQEPGPGPRRNFFSDICLNLFSCLNCCLPFLSQLYANSSSIHWENFFIYTLSLNIDTLCTLFLVCVCVYMHAQLNHILESLCPLRTFFEFSSEKNCVTEQKDHCSKGLSYWFLAGLRWCWCCNRRKCIILQREISELTLFVLDRMDVLVCAHYIHVI